MVSPSYRCTSDSPLASLCTKPTRYTASLASSRPGLGMGTGSPPMQSLSYMMVCTRPVGRWNLAMPVKPRSPFSMVPAKPYSVLCPSMFGCTRGNSTLSTSLSFSTVSSPVPTWKVTLVRCHTLPPLVREPSKSSPMGVYSTTSPFSSVHAFMGCTIASARPAENHCMSAVVLALRGRRPRRRGLSTKSKNTPLSTSPVKWMEDSMKMQCVSLIIMSWAHVGALVFSSSYTTRRSPIHLAYFMVFEAMGS
mmetsp:Transcript_4256/g.14448  ORF Transcript_4256/g.14448 Transcript_4256/m.14448 type:complete len:250 (-) Transcript_4256:767-1516(-)